MSSEQKPGDPADKAADGAFGGVQSHRAGYGDDKLQRLTEWLRAHPTATLASGEGALLLAEIDRLCDGDLQMQIDWAHWAGDEIDRYEDRIRSARAEIDRLRERLTSVEAERNVIMENGSLHVYWQSAPRESLMDALAFQGAITKELLKKNETLNRILAALREPSETVTRVVRREWHLDTTPDDLVRFAVAAAEQEVGG